MWIRLVQATQKSTSEPAPANGWSGTPNVLVFHLNQFSDAALGQIGRLAAKQKVLVVSGRLSSRRIHRVFEAGAHGCIRVDSTLKQLNDALRTVGMGLIYLDPRFATAVFAPAKPVDSPLTERERQVLELLVNGHTNKEIAESLLISVRTVETHRASLQKKLGTRGRAELLRIAMRSGLLDIRD